MHTRIAFMEHRGYGYTRYNPTNPMDDDGQ